jgi:adenylate cyclase
MRHLAALHARLTLPGRAIALIALLLFAVLRISNPVPLSDFRSRGFDLEQHLAPMHYPPLPVVIVAIDDRSLAKYGQWPWPRTLVARVVRRIAEGHPLALGVDIIFPEPDRLSPGRLIEAVPDLPPSVARELAEMPANEKALADAIRTIPTVLGLGALDQEPDKKLAYRQTPIRQVGPDPKQFLHAYPALMRSVPELTIAETSRAAIVSAPDRDGVVRRVPLFVVAEGHLIPGLALETLRVAAHENAVTVVSGERGIEGAALSDLFLPTDRQGKALLHFAPAGSVETVSAADLIGRAYDPGKLQGKAVLLGVTGAGLVDVKPTPLGLMDGIEIHAQLIQSALTRGLLRRPPLLSAAEIALLVGIGLFVIYHLPYGRPRTSAAIVLGIVAIELGAGFISFLFTGILLDSVYPAFCVVVVFGIMLMTSLRAAQIEIEHQREHRARLDGELTAAREIQMGLLPRKFPAFPEHHTLDIRALIEPARTIGGDFYDFIMIDQRHLFFIIADVSGKGVPAALFMATTKQVLRSASSQFGDQLGRVFGEANTQIAASSNDRFVTAFGGVLDLFSGALVYVSAGHDSPFLLRAGAPPQHLPTEGGPPLGAVEDFVFPVERFTLEPGDLLLLYTDGVTEAKDKSSAFYTSTRLEELLRNAPADGAAGAIDFVRNDLRRFVAEAEQADDITLLAVRWSGPEGQGA